MVDKKLVLITGASGFVGRHLALELLKVGYRIRAVCRDDKAPVGRSKEIEWIGIKDIGPRTDWSPALDKKVTHIVHLAAVAHRIALKDQVADSVYREVNHLGTVRLAEVAKELGSVRRFFFMSSIGAVTSLAAELVNEQTRCNPDTAYGSSKLAAEESIQKVFMQSQTEWCIFRAPLLYGPGNPGNMERLSKLVMLGIPLPLGSIRNRRTFLYVGNLIHAITVALEHPAAARRLFCVSDSGQMSTPDLLRSLGRASGRPVRLFPFPRVGLRLLGWGGDLIKKATGYAIGIDTQTIEKLCGSLCVDDSLFRRTCGWVPPYPVEEGLKETFATIKSPQEIA